jgi:hypothetical protein
MPLPQRLPRPELGRDITPGQPAPEPVDDPLDHPTVLAERAPATTDRGRQGEGEAGALRYSVTVNLAGRVFELSLDINPDDPRPIDQIVPRKRVVRRESAHGPAQCVGGAASLGGQSVARIWKVCCTAGVSTAQVGNCTLSAITSISNRSLARVLGSSEYQRV